MGRASYTAFREDRRRGLLTIGPIVIDGTPLARRDQEALLRDFDQDPSDWVLDREEFRPGTVSLTFKRVFIKPARRHTPRTESTPLPTRGESQVTVLVSDFQAPRMDKKFFAATLAYIREIQPYRIGFLGDGPDLATLSRFTPNPWHDDDVQACINGMHWALAELRAAAPNAEMFYVPGNHCQRLQSYVLTRARELHGVHRAGEITPVLSLPHLLCLDDLGIRWIASEFGEWPQSRIRLAPKLTAMHGDLVRKGAGQSALALLDRVGHSVICGHTHRAALVAKTLHNPDGSHSTHLGVECGTFAQIRGGLSYASDANWQNAFCEARIYSDGTFHLKLHYYQDGKLFVG